MKTVLIHKNGQATDTPTVDVAVTAPQGRTIRSCAGRSW